MTISRCSTPTRRSLVRGTRWNAASSSSALIEWSLRVTSRSIPRRARSTSARRSRTSTACRSPRRIGNRSTRGMRDGCCGLEGTEINELTASSTPRQVLCAKPFRSSSFLRFSCKSVTFAKLRSLMQLTFFETPSQFRAWLQKHHKTADEVWVGFYKKTTGKPSITWPEAVDEALCFGWIDGIRKSVDAESYTNRFTPRRPGSFWSAINTRRAAELIEQGRTRPPGRKAFDA